MKTLPKPKNCSQDWLEMTPTEGGRICRQCDKVIIDFSKMSWIEIKRIQEHNNNSVCGMYSPKQLHYWGQEVPKMTCIKMAATTALMFSMVTQSFGQKLIPKDINSRTIIHGTVTGKSQEGNLDSLIYTIVMFKGTKIGVVTDENGYYKFDITDYIDTISNPVILFSSLGYNELELKLNNSRRGEIKYDAKLNQDLDAIFFSVSKPTLRQRIKWKIKKWFGRKDN